MSHDARKTAMPKPINTRLPGFFRLPKQIKNKNNVDNATNTLVVFMKHLKALAKRFRVVFMFFMTISKYVHAGYVVIDVATKDEQIRTTPSSERANNNALRFRKNPIVTKSPRM